MEQLIINTISSEKRFALIKNGIVENIYIEQPGQQSRVGNIYMGMIEKVIPGMNAAFVNFGEEQSGFLPKDKLPGYVLLEAEQKASRPISSFIHQGEKLLVQIEKDAAGTKGARLTGIIEIQGDNLVYMPKGKYVAVSKKADSPEVRDKWREFAKELKSAEEGLIFRTDSLKQSEEAVTREWDEHRAQYQELLRVSEGMKKPGIVYKRDYFFEQVVSALSSLKEGTVIVDSLELKKKIEPLLANNDNKKVIFYNDRESIFSAYKIEQEIDRLLKRIVWLDKGAYMIIDQGEAFTMIDVNTGKFSGKTNLRDTAIKTNMNAAAEAARQMKLRDLAGIILIDFIDMQDNSDREMVVNVMRNGLQQDDRRSRIIGFTELGILQLTRKKTKRSIAETLTEKCESCGGSGHVISAETMAYRLERELWDYRNADHEAVLISATKKVIEHISGDGDIHKSRLETALGIKLFFTVIDSVKPDFKILKFGDAAELSQRQNN